MQLLQAVELPSHHHLTANCYFMVIAFNFPPFRGVTRLEAEGFSVLFAAQQAQTSSRAGAENFSPFLLRELTQFALYKK
jgi:hypothetical protein